MEGCVFEAHVFGGLEVADDETASVLPGQQRQFPGRQNLQSGA